MPKPACVPCGRFFRPHKNGARIIECIPVKSRARRGAAHAIEWTDYKLWMGDLWRCDGCGAQIAVGWGQRPMAEHYQPEFGPLRETATRVNGGPLIRIYDC